MRVGEHEFPELEITEYDPLVMAGVDRFHDLPEQSSSFWFTKPLPEPDVRVEVSVSRREHEVEVPFSEEYLVNRIDVRVRVYPVVRRQNRAVLPSNNLKEIQCISYFMTMVKQTIMNTVERK